jgi:hypothetical protein
MSMQPVNPNQAQRPIRRPQPAATATAPQGKMIFFKTLTAKTIPVNLYPGKLWSDVTKEIKANLQEAPLCNNPNYTLTLISHGKCIDQNKPITAELIRYVSEEAVVHVVFRATHYEGNGGGGGGADGPVAVMPTALVPATTRRTYNILAPNDEKHTVFEKPELKVATFKLLYSDEYADLQISVNGRVLDDNEILSTLDPETTTFVITGTSHETIRQEAARAAAAERQQQARTAPAPTRPAPMPPRTAAQNQASTTVQTSGGGSGSGGAEVAHDAPRVEYVQEAVPIAGTPIPDKVRTDIHDLTKKHSAWKKLKKINDDISNKKINSIESLQERVEQLADGQTKKLLTQILNQQ